MAADKILYDARSLLTALKSLDDVMKSSLKSLETDKNKSSAASSKAGSNKSVQKTGAGTAAGEDAPKVEVIKRTDRVVVRASIIFMKVGSIDTIHDRFQADVNVVLKWREPLLDGTKLKSEDIDWTKYWNPKVSLANGIGDPKSKVSLSVKYDVNGRATIRESRQMSGSFFEFMELNQFPFDKQDLTVTLVSDRDISELQLVADTDEKCGINAKAFSSEQEWKLFKEVNVWSKTVVKKANKMTKKYPGFNTAAKASRRPQFFIWNIIVIMSIICSMAFATFTVTVTTPHFRLQLTFILLLTTVTFKFAVNKNLPKISYLTLMDKYILSSMVILFSVCVWHAIIGPIAKSMAYTVITTSTATTTAAPPVDSTATSTSSTACPTTVTTSVIPNGVQLADYIALGVLLSLYVILHVVLILLIVCDSDDDMSLNIEIEPEDEPQNEDQPLAVVEGNGKSSTEKTALSYHGNGTAMEGLNNVAFYGDQHVQLPNGVQMKTGTVE